MLFVVVIFLSTSVILSLPIMLFICKHQKKPISLRNCALREFDNPDNEETDTYFGLNSSRLFPVREGRIIHSSSSTYDEKDKEHKEEKEKNKDIGEYFNRYFKA
ncbi:hypothetical protein DICVIV_05330 [Dictyocaulus viviparus]|uniref:Uncharacterized protein n=1 Tax=Dictyocaulus viviparus TaxID=29172 RepID=A0A0D8XXN9_DICVI|nr:hypothetical protein DICVIV_05330 [Dictyocaulus viviparus]